MLPSSAAKRKSGLSGGAPPDGDRADGRQARRQPWGLRRGGGVAGGVDARVGGGLAPRVFGVVVAAGQGHGGGRADQRDGGDGAQDGSQPALAGTVVAGVAGRVAGDVLTGA